MRTGSVEIGGTTQLGKPSWKLRFWDGSQKFPAAGAVSRPANSNDISQQATRHREEKIAQEVCSEEVVTRQNSESYQR